MRKSFYVIWFITIILSSCQNAHDRVVSEVYNHKLYESDIVKNIPSGLSVEDSIILFDQYVTNWINEQVLLYKAENELSVQEKNFDEKIKKYREHLLIEAYLNKITSDSLKFLVSDKELKYYIAEYKESEPIQKNVVRVNYVKLSKKSNIGNAIKEILFDEEKRVIQKNKLVALCSDSIEYFIDDDQWILLDYLENDFPFKINDKESVLGQYKKMDVSDDQYRYLIVFLDFKTQYTSSESSDEQNSIRNMLIQQKKVKYINKTKESLYQKAIRDGKIIQ